MEAGDQKWLQNGSLLGSPGARKSNEFKGFRSFFAFQSDPISGSFLDPRILGMFKKIEGNEEPNKESGNLEEPKSQNPGNN